MKYIIMQVLGGKIWKLYSSVLILMVYFILQQGSANNMIYGMEYKELIWSKIENGHSIQTYVIYNGDEREEHIMLEYIDGELMYIYTIWR